MNRANTPELIVAVLASGSSRRLGRDKAMVRIRGQTLLERTLHTLNRANAGRIVTIRTIVIRAPRQRRPLVRSIQWCINSDHRRGISSSIRRALRAARCARGTLFIAVDLYALDHRELARMLRAWRSRPTRIVARRFGAHGGMPLVLPKRHYGLARKISGDRGLAAVLSECGTEAIRWVEMASAAADIDTSADLSRAREQMRRARF
jgi:molybdenum cofactor cytidylyltransferase